MQILVTVLHYLAYAHTAIVEEWLKYIRYITVGMIMHRRQIQRIYIFHALVSRKAPCYSQVRRILLVIKKATICLLATLLHLCTFSRMLSPLVKPKLSNVYKHSKHHSRSVFLIILWLTMCIRLHNLPLNLIQFRLCHPPGGCHQALQMCQKW